MFAKCKMALIVPNLRRRNLPDYHHIYRISTKFLPRDRIIDKVLVIHFSERAMDYTRTTTHIDTTAPLIYMWEIKSEENQVVGRYIGKANGGEKRPTQHYPRNVRKLRLRKPYKNDKDYRRVHFALADAIDAGHHISLTYLCNVPATQNIFEVENRYIREYRCDADDGIGLNGPAKGPRRQLAAPAASGFPTQMEDEEDKQAAADLEDFVESVKDHYPALEIKARSHRYSIWTGDVRLARAKQAGPKGKVWIKLVQSTKNEKDTAWDGSDLQLAAMIDGELRAYEERRRQR